MKIFFRTLSALLLLVLPSNTASADEVLFWNNVLLDAIRTSSTPPPRASRAMAVVHTSIYDSVNSITGTHTAYHASFSNAGANQAAAIDQAARDALVGMFPALTATFDAHLAARLALIPDAPDKLAGISVGSQCAASILALRANDGSNAVVPYVPGSNPGDWKPTGPAFAPALLPQWPAVTPWTMSSGDAFRDPVGPPALTSAEYAADFNEVKELGSLNSATRTADQTSIAKFWADGGGTATPPGHWNMIAQDVAGVAGNTEAENARLFALLNVSLADAAIVAWDNKYVFDLWRPITAIHEASTDGNAATVEDAAWTPLLTTPPFPTYTSGHSTFSGAASAVLAEFFGNDNFSFTTSAEGFVEPDRSFTSFSQAAEEAGRSRIYGGIHFEFDNQHGLSHGRALAMNAMKTQMRAVPEPSAVLLVVSGVLCVTFRKRFVR